MGLYTRSKQFWAAQDAFWARMIERQEKSEIRRREGLGLGDDDKIPGLMKASLDRGRLAYARSRFNAAKKAGVWNPRADHLFRSRRASLVRTGWGVRVDQKLQGELLKLAESVAPRLTRAMDKHLSRLAFDVWREWPVDTGLSRALLDLEYTLAPGGRFRAVFASRAPYTMFIVHQPHRMMERGGQFAAFAIAEEAIDDLARA